MSDRRNEASTTHPKKKDVKDVIRDPGPKPGSFDVIPDPGPKPGYGGEGLGKPSKKG